jgi:hypothetical protein
LAYRILTGTGSIVLILGDASLRVVEASQGGPMEGVKGRDVKRGVLEVVIREARRVSGWQKNVARQRFREDG